MATAVDICNLALASLGDAAEVTSINPPEGSAQAGHCARWFPIALRRMYEEFDWSFAIKRASLTKISDVDTSIYGNKNVFSLPANCVRVVNIKEFGGNQLRDIDFDIELVGFTQSVITESKSPICFYIEYTDSTALLPTYFIDALAVLLASFLVGPLKRSDSASAVAQNLLKQFAVLLSQAKTLDSNMSQRKLKRNLPTGIQARIV